MSWRFPEPTYHDTTRILEEAYSAASNVLDRNGVNDYQSFWKLQENIMSVYWSDGFSESEIQFEVVSPGKVSIATYYDTPQLEETDSACIGITESSNLEPNVSAVFGILEGKV